MATISGREKKYFRIDLDNFGDISLFINKFNYMNILFYHLSYKLTQIF